MEENFGETFAKENGYVLHSYSGTRNNMGRANYMKGELCLTVLPNGEAELTQILGLVQCKIGPFSIPNKNFKMFEKQLFNVIQLDF